jgi:DNA helicase II / ATP-dependent DNA helicase PcrA
MTDADAQLEENLNSPVPQSFMLFAGAGAGKTWSLVNSLRAARYNKGYELSVRGARIGAITYTHAAAEEIARRLESDPLFHVATIHSFAWELIRRFPLDLSNWLNTYLTGNTEELAEEEDRGKAGTAASADRIRKMARNRKRLLALPGQSEFVYSPSQTRPLKGGVAHHEVIGAFTSFLNESEVFREIFVSSYPILFVDEVQDTNRGVMDALLKVQKLHNSRFTLGLFGDTMQRVYLDGKPDLAESIPESWLRPSKLLNRRSATRIIDLNNSLRAGVDGLQQEAIPGASTGVARLFIASSSADDKNAIEADVRKRMAEISSDEKWTQPNATKTLILEHAMASSRLGFEIFFEPFRADRDVRSTLTSRDSAGSGKVRFLGHQVLRLVEAVRRADWRSLDSLIKELSPLYEIQHTDENFVGSRQLIRDSLRAFESKLDSAGQDITIREVISTINELNLLELPEDLSDLLAYDSQDLGTPSDEDLDPRSPEMTAWALALEAPLREFEQFYTYVLGDSEADTQQGVKGLEFERVLVLLDDKEAGGNLFSYGKLFGTSELTSTDRNNISIGKESTLDRTRRLLYVACSRAVNGVAVLLYVDDPSIAAELISELHWFSTDEIELLG